MARPFQFVTEELLPFKDPEAQRAWHRKDRESGNAAKRLREFRARHRERVRAQARIHSLAFYHRVQKHDPDFVAASRARASAWYRANKERAFLTAKVHASHRRKLVKHATPAWANLFFMREIYDLAQLRTKATGIPWEVDHIVPLRGRNVCGLHWEGNMRVVPKSENRSKSFKTLEC